MNKARWILISGLVAISAYGVDGLAQTAAAPAAPAAAAPAAPEALAAPAPVAAAPAPVAAAPVAVAPAAAPEAQGQSDHDSVVGHLGVGYLGFTTIPFGALDPANLGNDYPAAQVANAPVVGIRYWFSSAIGLDVGIGFTTTFGNNSTPDPAGGTGTVTTNATAPTAFAVHGGLPLAFASAKHFTFELIPELNFGYAQQSLIAGVAPATATLDLSGTHFDVGARVGAEIQFGFIGIPQLSLQGSVGLRADVNSTSTKTTPDTAGAAISTSSSSRSTIGTTVGNNPWDIFRGNIYAIYYL
jgi:hypothetical protein